MRITEALEKFVTQLQADGRSRHTVDQYRRHIRLFAAWAADVGVCGDEIERLGHEAVAKFLASTAATGSARGGTKKAVTANAMRSSVKNFLKYCHQAGLTTGDAGRLIRRARCSSPPPKAMTEGEQAQLLAVLSTATSAENARDHALFATMLATGIRLGSAIALDVADVDLARAQLTIRRAKNDAPDVVYLNDTIKAHLTRFLAGRTAGPLFLANGARVSQRHAQRRFSLWLAKAGITRKLSCHATRHSFAMKVYGKCGDILIVKEALRHRSIASTLAYAKLSEDRLRASL